jgi:AraC-like DNA-binding protein
MELASGYRECAAPRPLDTILTCLWSRAAGPDGPASTLVLPDGCVDLIWQQGRGAFVAGPDTGPNPAPMSPGTIYLGARFHPGAGGQALGVPLAGLRDQRVDLTDLRPDLARFLPAETGPDEAFRRMLQVCARTLASSQPDRLALAGARLLRDPRTRVGDLPEVLGVSERQLRRRFDVAVGYGPKTLQRVLRFRRFLTRVSDARDIVDIARLAIEIGYADQSHLTREATALSGLTPRALADEAHRTR